MCVLRTRASRLGQRPPMTKFILSLLDNNNNNNTALALYILYIYIRIYKLLFFFFTFNFYPNVAQNLGDAFGRSIFFFFLLKTNTSFAVYIFFYTGRENRVSRCGFYFFIILTAAGTLRRALFCIGIPLFVS